MDSGSQSDKPPQEPSRLFANIIGTAIAVITLITPIIAIALFSSQSGDILRSPPYTLTRPGR
ncbi:MAG: hypothetical protein AAF327_25860 [Cyanobacteria bacterium P01_A01_bin.37]